MISVSAGDKSRSSPMKICLCRDQKVEVLLICGANMQFSNKDILKFVHSWSISHSIAHAKYLYWYKDISFFIAMEI